LVVVTVVVVVGCSASRQPGVVPAKAEAPGLIPIVDPSTGEVLGELPVDLCTCEPRD